MDPVPYRILALGDSLTAGYNLPQANAFPVRLEAALRDKGYAVQVINAGVSGDTTAGGRARLDWAMGDHPDAAIIELGANDALRGLDPTQAFDNLDAILDRLSRAKVKVLLAGMLAPRNMGADYAKAFDGIYPRLAAKWKVPLYPFFLDGVALHADLTQADGLHPTAAGVDRIVSAILPSVEAVIGSAAKAPRP
jgi:acyl-CoA thioesterase-1